MDGTTKFGKHYVTYDITVQDSHTVLVFGTCSLVVHKNTLETFEEILDDIDCVQQALGKDAASSKIVAKIKTLYVR